MDVLQFQDGVSRPRFSPILKPSPGVPPRASDLRDHLLRRVQTIGGPVETDGVLRRPVERDVERFPHLHRLGKRRIIAVRHPHAVEVERHGGLPSLEQNRYVALRLEIAGVSELQPGHPFVGDARRQ